MTGKEFLKYLNEKKYDSSIVAEIEMIYNALVPDEMKLIVSNSESGQFLEGGYRVLALDEIKNAENDLHVPFMQKGIIPIIDCGENDFIIYNFKKKYWAIFNIVEDVVFKKRSSLEELLL